MRQIVRYTKTLRSVLPQVLLHQLPEEVDQACFYVFVEQIDQAVFDVPQFGADLLAITQGQVRPAFQQPLEIVDRKSAKAHVVLVGLGEFPVQIAPLQAELAKKFAPLNDLLHLFIPLLIDITDLDRSLFYKIDLIDFDIFSLKFLQ